MEIKNSIIDEIYYSKEYQMACRAPSEKFLFMQWILDLVCLMEALNDDYDRWYQQLFYIKLAGLFDIMQRCNTISTSEDKYIHRVKSTLDLIYNSLSADECIYIVYRRNTSAHPFVNGYDLYNASGEKFENTRDCKIKGECVPLHREDLDRAIGRILEANGNDEKNIDNNLVRKLSPLILQFKEGLLDKYRISMKFF